MFDDTRRDRLSKKSLKTALAPIEDNMELDRKIVFDRMFYYD
jgi:hypothetical protein